MLYKFRTSLTRQQQKLFIYIRNLCAEAEEINFIFSDINSNLKIRLKELIRNQQYVDPETKLTGRYPWETRSEWLPTGWSWFWWIFGRYSTRWRLSQPELYISLIYYFLVQKHLSNDVPDTFALNDIVPRSANLVLF